MKRKPTTNYTPAVDRYDPCICACARNGEREIYGTAKIGKRTANRASCTTTRLARSRSPITYNCTRSISLPLFLREAFPKYDPILLKGWDSIIMREDTTLLCVCV